jgi:hypothetical protein
VIAAIVCYDHLSAILPQPERHVSNTSLFGRTNYLSTSFHIMELGAGSPVAKPALNTAPQARRRRTHTHGLSASPQFGGQARTRDSVYRRITAIIGVHLTRSELAAIVSGLGWVPVGRNEKRVKPLLIQRLEAARDKILPALDTAQGVRELERAYVALLERKRIHREPGVGDVAPSVLPPEATVDFYLNQHEKTDRGTSPR